MLTAASIVAGLYSFMCIPIVVALWALMIGYCLRCMRFKAVNPECKLPDWNDWGDLFLSGVTWIALQFMLWVLMSSIAFGIIVIISAYAIAAKSTTESYIEMTVACAVIGVLFFFVSALSAFAMVNFALEENSAAGLSFIKVGKRVFAEPSKYFGGFLLAIGLQWAAIIIPSLTVVGVFLIPSAYFVGQVASAAVLARTWSSTIGERKPRPSVTPNSANEST